LKKIIINLDTNKNVELTGFNISGSNSVSMTIKFVELNIKVPYSFDFSNYPAWKEENPTLTWKDFMRSRLITLYDSYALSQEIKQLMDEEATEKT